MSKCTHPYTVSIDREKNGGMGLHCTLCGTNFNRPLERSTTPDVRNPMLALPGVREAVATIATDARAALKVILMALRKDAQEKAAKSWRTHKAPMALYWKCVAVYAGHIARLLRN